MATGGHPVTEELAGAVATTPARTSAGAAPTAWLAWGSVPATPPLTRRRTTAASAPIGPSAKLGTIARNRSCAAPLAASTLDQYPIN